MSTITRFAPSPTGLLHVGNARMALVNWLLARHDGGQMILRFDDTDPSRSTATYAAAIEQDLRWLGLDWDRTERQSARLDAYNAAFDKLQAADRVYACYETAEELEYMRRRLRAQHKAPIYQPPDADKIRAFAAEGRKPHWRFRLADGDIRWQDQVRGPVHFEARNLSDPVIRREDGSWLYMLPSAIDDMDMAITHVVRGEDHVANTALQVQMFEALGGKPPAFAHLPLLTDLEGGGLSKRLGSLSLQELRENGIEAWALMSYLAHLGTSDDIKLADNIDALVRGFDLSHFGRGSPKFDDRQLDRLNAQVLHSLSYAEARARLAALGLAGVDEALWLAVRANLARLSETATWLAVARGEATPVIAAEDEAFIKAARGLLPAEPWNPETWGLWTAAVKAATGAKGKALFMPLRRALTGLDHGPELKALLPLIGRARAMKRLSGEKG